MKKIILNCLPPANIEYPSAGLSILKSFLIKNGFDVRIVYWNILTYDILSGFKRDQQKNIAIELIPFLTFLLNGNIDESFKSRIKATLLSKCNSPELLEKIRSNNIFNEFRQKLNLIINNEFDKIDSEGTLLVGFSSKFSQWIPASILATQFKLKFSNIKTVFGGFATRNEAYAALNSSKNIDYAIWGEGEFPLVELCTQLLGNEKFENIPRLIYRKVDKIIYSNNSNGKYLNFEEPLNPNYDDYFSLFKDFSPFRMFLPIETTRGCHWGKCKFCIETKGIKYRQKSAEYILKEMEYLSKKYNSNRFTFLDSDTIGKNAESFIGFLDMLIYTKISNDISFEVTHAEINPKNLSAEIIKKMVLAGFKSVQIGFEAVTDTLLHKMKKKNGYANNIFFIKFALKYGLKVNGANIITGIVDEEESDIYESIQNLHYLRFFLKKGKFELKAVLVQIFKDSEFYKLLSDKQLEAFDENPVIKLLPQNFVNADSRFDLFGFHNYKTNTLWEEFIELGKHYCENNYSYSLIEENGIIQFEEFFESDSIKTIVFSEPEYWDILEIANNKIVGIKEIEFGLSKRNKNLSRDRILQILLDLNSEYLLYFNKGYTYPSYQVGPRFSRGYSDICGMLGL